MSTDTRTDADTRADADACARAAADRHGLRIVELRAAAEHHAAADLLCRVWRADSPDVIVNAGLMTAFAHSGNYVAGAYHGEDLVGAAVGFLGTGHLHSHVTGVATQSGGVGFALKQHQRAWALARGIAEVCWTFDPLVGRNAYFNLHKLGALPTEYLPDFYGALGDGINAGDATDRLYVRWRLQSRAAIRAAHGQRADVDLAAVRAAGAARLVERLEGDRPAVDVLPADGRALLVAVPRDIEELRARDPGLAADWRRGVREALVPALAAGYMITGMSRDGYYTLHLEGRP